MGLPKNATGGQLYKLYTGVADMNVVALNPSLSDLQELGLNLQREPVYFSAEKGLRLDFYLDARLPGDTHKIVKHSAWIKPKPVMQLYINNQSKFSRDASSLGASARHPYDGEVDLMLFLQVVLDQKKDQELYLETIDDMVANGTVDELAEAIEGTKGNMFKGLLGIREDKDDATKKYQHVYNKVFLRAYAKSYEYLFRSLVENKDHIKEYYGPIDYDRPNAVFVPQQFSLREFDPLTGESLAPAGARTPVAQAHRPAAKPATSDAPVANFAGNGYAGPTPQTKPQTQAQPGGWPGGGGTSPGSFTGDDDNELPF